MSWLSLVWTGRPQLFIFFYLCRISTCGSAVVTCYHENFILRHYSQSHPIPIWLPLPLTTTNIQTFLFFIHKNSPTMSEWAALSQHKPKPIYIQQSCGFCLLSLPLLDFWISSVIIYLFEFTLRLIPTFNTII